MKLVIEIHELDKKRADLGMPMHPYRVDKINDAIRKGTPLPKEHGRLKDVDAFLSKVKADREHSVYSRSWTADDVLTALDNSYALTIIEGEKQAESEEP